MDAAHFVMGAFLSQLWCFCRMYIRTPSGRKRFNVLGAYNAVTGKLYTVCNDSYINSQSVCAMLRKLRQYNQGKSITIVLDNAAYQRARIVRELAEKLDVHLLFLPSYSPNLNLIERYWKFLKKECLNNRYYEHFESFRGAITNFTQSAHRTHKMQLKSLMTLKFQTFQNDEILTA